MIITMDYTGMCTESSYRIRCANHACQVMVPLVLCFKPCDQSLTQCHGVQIMSPTLVLPLSKTDMDSSHSFAVT